MRVNTPPKTRDSFAIVVLKRVGFAILFCTTLAAHGQDWETPIQLTDGYNHGGAQLVVDSLHRIHMFTVKSRMPGPNGAQPNTLYYYRYDNWGRPLQEGYELLPDTHWIDHSRIGVLLDHLERIHVVWLRHFDSSLPIKQLIYVQMSLEGEFLQYPLIYEVLDNQPFGIDDAAYHLVETVTGEIWAACGNHYFAVDAAGNLIEPVQHIIPPPAQGYVRMAAAPDGSVWGTFRKHDIESDTLKTVRYWPPPRVEETTLLCDNPGFGPQAFAIDQYGAFHYVIYTEDSGLFYRFDPRGMGQILTTVFDPTPYGASLSNFLAIGMDSLQFMWGQSLPEIGVHRVCFTIDGNLAFGPLLLQSQPQFDMADYACFWRDGGYWVPGSSSWDGIQGSVAMLHVPGPEEPLAVSERPSSQVAEPTIQVYPQPSNGTFYFHLPTNSQGDKQLTIYNLLGQRVFESALPSMSGSELFGVQLPIALPTGTYLLSLATQTQQFTSRIILVK